VDSKSAAEVTASLADALEELHRLQRRLDRRMRPDQRLSEERGPSRPLTFVTLLDSSANEALA
jgi:hypothetical protein